MRTGTRPTAYHADIGRRDWAWLNNDQIAAIPELGELETMVVLSEIKSDTTWPPTE